MADLMALLVAEASEHYCRDGIFPPTCAACDDYYPCLTRQLADALDAALHNAKSAFDVLEGMKEQVAERDELKRELRAERKAREEAERQRDGSMVLYDRCIVEKKTAEARGRELGEAVDEWIRSNVRSDHDLLDALQRFKEES